MRIITEKSVRAFMNATPFKSGNMHVTHTPFDGTRMYLHGNCIAHRDADGIFISNAGWESNTTKERLNGILDWLNQPRIYQKDWVWYWKDGEEFPSNTFVKVQ